MNELEKILNDISTVPSDIVVLEMARYGPFTVKDLNETLGKKYYKAVRNITYKNSFGTELRTTYIGNNFKSNYHITRCGIKNLKYWKRLHKKDSKLLENGIKNIMAGYMLNKLFMYIEE